MTGFKRVLMSLIAAILAPMAYAADVPPTVYSAICDEAAPTAAPTFEVVIGDPAGAGWPVFALPTEVLAGGGCAGLLAVPEGDRRYVLWAPDSNDVRVRVEVDTGGTGGQ